ncbi:MAG: phBC6A51 family helix-turn-helix protein, partial [Gloeomargarita sp. SKYB31]|nr:phBC6A51 family helix-turn-helix protein [Gloeomargarita sp. SKYB31]
MLTSVERLDDLQKRAAWLLLGGLPVTEVARQLGVSRVAIWQWRKSRVFQEYLRGLVQESLDCRRYKVQRLVDTALETLQQALTDERVPLAKRGELACRWLALVTGATPLLSESPSPADDARPAGAISPATLEVIRTQVYGL